jgi:hypothetical protein
MDQTAPHDPHHDPRPAKDTYLALFTAAAVLVPARAARRAAPPDPDLLQVVPRTVTPKNKAPGQPKPTGHPAGVPDTPEGFSRCGCPHA